MADIEHHIKLEEREAAFIDSQLASGAYRDANAVVAAALQLMRDEEAALRDALEKGQRDFDEGRYTLYDDADQLIADIKRNDTRRAAS